MKRRVKRGVSLGTVVMLTLCCLVLGGFFALMPKLTGQKDLRVNASELAVAIDRGILQFSGGTVAKGPRNTPLPNFTAAEQTQPQQDAPSATQAPAATAAPKVTFTLCAGGSLKFDDATRKAMTDQSGYRFQTLLENVSGNLASDLTLTTLEDSVMPSQKLSDINLPSELLSALQGSGVDALCLGHFNVVNGGVDGLRETKESICAAGLLPYGAYATQEERGALTLTKANGVSVALLSYQNGLSATGKKKTTAAEQAFVVADLDLTVIQADIQAAKALGAQVIVVSLCWGKVGASAPTEAQQKQAQEIANAGADIILGTHSETVQPVALLTAERGDGRYHPTLCAYSLGNLFTYERDKRAGLAGVLLHMTVVYDQANGTVAFDNLGYTPTYCWRGREDGAQRYRVLPSAAETRPDYVNDDQANVMQKCLKMITDVMDGGAFALEP